MADPVHTYSADCPICGDGRSGTRCDHYQYNARRVRFVLAHREAFNSAYLNPDKRAASNELERLNREYATLPPRHDCSCQCPNVRHGRMRCDLCKELDEQRPKGTDVAVEIGHTARPNPPTPSPELLDLERALAVVGDGNPVAIARYMSVNGTSMAPVPLPVVVTTAPPDPIHEEPACDCLGYQLFGADFCVHLAAEAKFLD